MREIDDEGGKDTIYSKAGRGETFEQDLTPRLSWRAVLQGSVGAEWPLGPLRS
jgi:hypothetical protein